MADLATLAQVKQYIGGAVATTTVSDALLAALITGSSAAIQNFLNRDLSFRRRTEVYDGTGSVTITLHDYPVETIHALTINDVAIPQSVGVNSPGWVKTRAGAALRGGYRFEKGLQNVVMDYSAGYAVIPAEIQQSCIKLVASEFKRRDVINVASKGIGGESISFNADDVREAVKSLSSYQRVTP